MTPPNTPYDATSERLHQRVCEILVAAQTGVARTVNTAQGSCLFSQVLE
jgi:hypothetical protein